MNSRPLAFTGARIHDGTVLHDGQALLIAGQQVSVCDPAHVPADCAVTPLDGGIICPGFVDLQLNGGGGVMFNDDPSVEALRIIAEAHARCGSSALLPTLITDTPDCTAAAIDAVEAAIDAHVPGIVGLHLEGPHLSVARKGAHDPGLIRPMQDDDLALIIAAAERLPTVMVTVAPENTTNDQIAAMTDAGIVVSLGHTDASFDQCMAAFDAGASCVTHLFNAMSQMGNRTPGLVGAALCRDDVHAGLIADGIHVHPATMRNALAAKANPEQIFLVTDAMATAGSEIDGFDLNGRHVMRRENRLTLQDGTLAGADLTLPQALGVITSQSGDTIERAIRRATSIPAGLLRESGTIGTLNADPETLLYLSEDLSSHKPLLASTATARRSA